MNRLEVYQIEESELTIKPFDIPDYWPRAFGLDVGWNRTAAIWGAKDPQSQVVYLYSHYRAHDEPSVHIEALKSGANGHRAWLTRPHADGHRRTAQS